jgi:hypothetical protein
MTNDILPFTPVLIKLLKGPVEYLERPSWELLIRYRVELTGFLQQLGLMLVLDEHDGYAYLKQVIVEEDDKAAVSWVQRRALTYEESIMLVLLREMMAEFEVGDATSRELIRKRREIREYAELFFREKASRVRFIREIDRLIEKAEELGFLELTEKHDVPDEHRYRVRKIIKARVDSDILEEFRQQLEEYAARRIQHG